MDSDSPSWSDLRSDLLLNITNRLYSGIDRLSFRAVCHSWRSLLPPQSRRPPLRPPFPMGPSPHLNPERRGYFNLVQSTVQCLQHLKKIVDTRKTPKCWLIKNDETEEPVKVIVRFLNLILLNFFPSTPRKVAVCSEGAASAVMGVHTDGKLSIWRTEVSKLLWVFRNLNVTEDVHACS